MPGPLPPEERLIVALDVPSGKEALTAVRLLSPEVRLFKVGLELFVSEGPMIVEKIDALGGKVFLDLKFFDIPNTMAGAVASAAECGAFMMNVHALAGETAMKRCAEALSKLPNPPKLIAVTILTSFDEATLAGAGIRGPLKERVSELCRATLDSGLDGVVASPMETAGLRKMFGKEFLIVTPGVRPEWSGSDDQKRTATPQEAVATGADYIVVGRPILRSDDPLSAVARIKHEIEKGLR